MAKSTTVSTNYKPYAYAGIILAVLYIPVSVFAIVKAFSTLPRSWSVTYILAMGAYAACFLYFVWGFKLLGEETGNRLLVITSLLSIVFQLASTAYDFLLIAATPSELVEVTVSIAVLILAGVLSILIGVAFNRLKERFGNIATAAGVLNIIAGACFLSILLSPLALLLAIPVTIVEVMILFRASGGKKRTAS